MSFTDPERLVLEWLLTTPTTHSFDGRDVCGLKARELKADLQGQLASPEISAALATLKVRGLVWMLALGEGLWTVKDPADARDRLDGRGVHVRPPRGPRLRLGPLAAA